MKGGLLKCAVKLPILIGGYKARFWLPRRNNLVKFKIKGGEKNVSDANKCDS